MWERKSQAQNENTQIERHTAHHREYFLPSFLPSFQQWNKKTLITKTPANSFTTTRMLQRSRRKVNGDGKRSEIKPKKTKITEIQTDRQTDRRKILPCDPLCWAQGWQPQGRSGTTMLLLRWGTAEVANWNSAARAPLLLSSSC